MRHIGSALSAALVGAGLFVQPAAGAPLTAGSITVGDATISVVSCAFGPAACPSTAEFVAATGPTVGFVIDNSLGGPLITTGQDIGVMFEVTTSLRDITSIELSATGSGVGSVGETVLDSSSNPCGISSGSPTVSVGSSTTIDLTAGYAACQSTTQRDIYIYKDISAGDPAGNPGTVTSVTQYLTGDPIAAPEPLSSAVFAVGLLGLLSVRRRTR